MDVKKSRWLLALAAVVVVAIVAAACLGGGGGKEASPSTTTIPKEPGNTAEVKGVVGISCQAIEGPLLGSQLTPVVHANDFWFAWAAFNPDDPVYTGGGG